MDTDTVVIALVLATVLVVSVLAIIHVRRTRDAVRSRSIALIDLARLNSQFRSKLPRFRPIRYSFSEQVNSKAKFDRCDLGELTLQVLQRREAEIQPDVALRLGAIGSYSEYTNRYRAIASRLGKSKIDDMDTDAFNRIEARLFRRGKLSAPVCRATVRVQVSYRSPKGQNSYNKRTTVDFDQLVHALEVMRRTRELHTTSYFLRQQERSRMNAKLRADVLRRDQSRCCMCGRTAAVVPLHVDHIIPISKGGKTIPTNLQTLCQDCNLGKSNRL